MDVLVRIEMAGVVPNQTPERGELPRYLFFQLCNVIQRHNLIERYPIPVSIGPFTEIDVQAKAETTAVSAVRGGFSGSRPTHH